MADAAHVRWAEGGETQSRLQSKDIVMVSTKTRKAKHVHVCAYLRTRFGRLEHVCEHYRSWPGQLSFEF